MSDKLSRKQIKHDIREDEVKSVITHAFEWVYANGRLLAYAGVALVAVVIAAFAVASYLDRRELSAMERLNEAMKIYDAPLIGDESAPPADDDAPQFTSEEERRAAAKAVFTEVREETGGVAADVAGLYLAEIAAEEGDVETARELWQTFVDEHGDHMLAISARVNLIHLDRQEGQAATLAESLREEVTSGGETLPMDVALYELGRTLETLDQHEEAKLQYQRLIDEYGASPYAADARRRLGEA